MSHNGPVKTKETIETPSPRRQPCRCDRLVPAGIDRGVVAVAVTSGTLALSLEPAHADDGDGSCVWSYADGNVE
jgi:hypothetical protein